MEFGVTEFDPATGHRPLTPTEQIRANGARCLVCTTQIPPQRERMRSVTCSDACKEALRIRRLDILRTQKCPHCNHPSTPEEWQQFKRWRHETGGSIRGYISPGRGNQQWRAKARKFAQTLAETAQRLEGMRMASFYTATGGETVEGSPEHFRASLDEILKGILAVPFAKVLQPDEKPIDAEPEQ